MTNTEIEALRTAAEKATPGPWFYQERSDAYMHIVRPESKPGSIVAYGLSDTCGISEGNTRFIVAANPAVIIALLDHVAEIEQKLLLAEMKAEGLARQRDGAYAELLVATGDKEA